jgi:hypothetical protein
MRIINCTPHAVVLHRSDGTVTAFSPSGSVARCDEVRGAAGALDGAPVFSTRFGQVTGLPEPEPETVYIVSALVRGALAGSRTDVVSPDTGTGAVRDDAGRIVGTKGWVR